MTETGTCAQCGATIRGRGVQGLCPACLARLAFSVEEIPAPSDPEGSVQPATPASRSKLRYFGDYELLEEIARGGVGVVYRARQRSLHREVAVKMLLFNRQDQPEFIRRFKAEAEAAANLQHPNIVAIHEVGEHEGQHYFSMDYVAGQNLAQRARGTPLPPELATDYLRTIAKAVHYAHQRGVLHRDLKPSNILIDAFDQPRVTDFGLAKRLGSDLDLTVTGQIMGTPQYMSPEQARGHSDEVTLASDLYSLGAILYFLLTGRPPFQADTMEGVLHRLLNEEPMPPRQLNPAVPRDLETICLKCLAKEPHRRYATAQEIADELDRYLRGEPIHAHPLSPPQKVWRWCRRRPLVAGLLVALHVVFALGLAGVLWQWREARQAQREATEKLQDSYLAQARAKRQSDIAGRREEALDLIARATAIRPTLELRNEAIAALATMDVRPGRTWHVTNVADWVPWHFDGDFQTRASVQDDGAIHLHRVSDDAEIAVLRHPFRRVEKLYEMNAVSLDGRHIAAKFAGEKHWAVWAVASGQLVLDDQRCEHGVAFSRDGSRLVASHADGTVALYDLASGETVASVPGGQPAQFVRLSPEGGRVLSCEPGDWEVRLCAFATGEERWLTTAEPLYQIDWGPGELLAASSRNGRIYIWDARDGQLQHLVEAHDGLIQQLAFNHRGDLLGSVSWDGSTRFSNPWTGRVELIFPRHAQHLSFSRDDRQFSLAKLALGERSQFAFLEMDESPVFQRIQGRNLTQHAWALEFSPDGRWLASAAGASLGVRLYDARSRRLLTDLPESTLRMVLFEPDGKSLLTGDNDGIWRWPILGTSDGGEESVSFGPRARVSPLTKLVYGRLTRDGRWLACTCNPGHVWLVDLNDPDHPIPLGAHAHGQMIAISPDGQWIASGNWHGNEGVKVWQTATRQVVKTIPLGMVTVAWSPDGRWLSCSGGDGYHDVQDQVFETGGWSRRYLSERKQNASATVFSPDSRHVAFVDNLRRIRLLETGNFRHVATLEAPGSKHIVWLAFSPDGTRLAAQEYSSGIQLWDLTRLRVELRERGLDWETPR